MTDKQITLNTLLEAIEADLRANRLWHARNAEAIIEAGHQARLISLTHGTEAGDRSYIAGLALLHLIDTDDGLPKGDK